MITRSSIDIERSRNHDQAQNHPPFEQRILAVTKIPRFCFEALRGMGEISYVNDRRKIYYIGGMHHGMPSGRGIMLYQNGDIYYGWWRRGLKQGYGELIRENGGYLEGMWRHDTFTAGTVYHPNGDVEGIFDEMLAERISLRQGHLSTQILRIIREAMYSIGLKAVHGIRFGYHNTRQIIQMIYNLRHHIGQ